MPRDLFEENGISSDNGPKDLFQQEGVDVNDKNYLPRAPEPSFGEKLGPNILAGLAEMGHNVINAPHNIANIISPKLASYIPSQENYDYPSLLKLPESATLSDKLVRGLAQYSPAFVAPAADLGAAGEAISSIPKVGGFVQRALSLGLPQAGFNATQSENPLHGAEAGLAGGALGAGLESGVNLLRPSNLFRGNLSPEELKGNLESAGQSPTSIGDIIGSPMLKRSYENLFSKLPFSGANNKLQQAGQYVQQQGENILSKSLGVNNSENVTDQLHEALIKQFEKHQSQKNDLYSDFNNEAEKQFLNLPLTRFSNKAKEYINAIEDTNILKYEPELRNILSKLNIYKNPVAKVSGDESPLSQYGEKMIGEPLNTFVMPTAQEANLLKGKLNNYAKTLGSSPDPEKRYQAKILGDLGRSLKEDINESVDNSGNPTLKEKYNKAEENYKKNFSPFLDKEVYKFIGGNADADTIVQKFLTTGSSSDRANRLEKLTEKLPPEQRNLVTYSYLSRALNNEGELNPSKLATLINKLGPNQFKALVPDTDLRKELTDYKKLSSMNSKGINLMLNPATGQQNLDILPALIAHSLSALGGGALGGLTGAVGGLIAPGIVSKPIVNLMTSPSVREKLIKAMIENKRMKLPSAVSGAASTGISNIGNQ